MLRVVLVALTVFWAWEFLRVLVMIPRHLHAPIVAALCYGAAYLPGRVLDALAAAALVGITHATVVERFTPVTLPRRSPRTPRL